MKRKDLETLRKIWKDEDKVIVVSHWILWLHWIIGFFIGSCGNNFERAQSQMSYITLSVLITKRAEVVDKSNQNNRNPRVPLSLIAGGMGLNLVCNHILLFNLRWEHQLESQSHKRIYRVGQEKQERIYIFTIIF